MSVGGGKQGSPNGMKWFGVGVGRVRRCWEDIICNLGMSTKEFVSFVMARLTRGGLWRSEPATSTDSTNRPTLKWRDLLAEMAGTTKYCHVEE